MQHSTSTEGGKLRARRESRAIAVGFLNLAAIAGAVEAFASSVRLAAEFAEAAALVLAALLSPFARLAAGLLERPVEFVAPHLAAGNLVLPYRITSLNKSSV